MPRPTTTAKRIARLPRRRVLGIEVAVAGTLPARLRGLAGLEREAVGRGLLIERCRSVHTFGMRFDLDVVFLDQALMPVARRNGVGPRRLMTHRAASAVLELPSRG